MNALMGTLSATVGVIGELGTGGRDDPAATCIGYPARTIQF